MRRSYSKWSDEEEKLLTDAVHEYISPLLWTKLREILPNRSRMQCLAKIKRSNLRILRLTTDLKAKEIIKNAVANYPQNLTYAFQKAAEALNISPGTIRFYWYQKEESPINRDKIGTCFFLKSKGMSIKNRKVIK